MERILYSTLHCSDHYAHSRKEFNCQSRVHPGDKVFYPRIIEQINSNTRKEQAQESKKSEKSVDIVFEKAFHHSL